jgi:hypothetical protein
MEIKIRDYRACRGGFSPPRPLFSGFGPTRSSRPILTLTPLPRRRAHTISGKRKTRAVSQRGLKGKAKSGATNRGSERAAHWQRNAVSNDKVTPLLCERRFIEEIGRQAL